jgi:transcriptional regulator with XRE-family HTH domain
MAETQDFHNVALGRAVRRLREEAGLTPDELAERTRVPAVELRAIEAGEVEADWGTLRGLACGMSVELADLFKLTEALEEDAGGG